MLKEILKEKDFTMYKLSKMSGVPYSTVSDICTGKTKLEKCSAETIYKVAKALKVTMEELLAPCVEERDSFEIYKSNVCHKVKTLGDVEFVIEVLEANSVRDYYRRRWYPECFYMLAMVDYLCRVNDIPLCEEYDDLRRFKLQEPIYPASLLIADSVLKDKSIREKAYEEAIPEFKRFNIIENEVRNVV